MVLIIIGKSTPLLLKLKTNESANFSSRRIFYFVIRENFCFKSHNRINVSYCCFVYLSDNTLIFSNMMVYFFVLGHGSQGGGQERQLLYPARSNFLLSNKAGEMFLYEGCSRKIDVSGVTVVALKFYMQV